MELVNSNSLEWRSLNMYCESNGMVLFLYHLAKQLVKENEYLADGNFLNDNSNQKWGFNV